MTELTARNTNKNNSDGDKESAPRLGLNGKEKDDATDQDDERSPHGSA